MGLGTSRQCELGCLVDESSVFVSTEKGSRSGLSEEEEMYNPLSCLGGPELRIV